MRDTVADILRLIADPLLVLAIAASVYTGMCMALLLAAQMSGAGKRIEWPRYLYIATGLWVAWVIVR